MLSRLGVVAIKGLVLVLSLLPERAVLLMGRGIADLVYWLGLRRRTLMDNLDHVYGDRLSDQEKRRIAREATRNAVLAVLESLRASSPRCGPQMSERLRMSDPALMDACAEDARGVLFEWEGDRVRCERAPRVEQEESTGAAG